LPERALASGFSYQHNELGPTLAAIFGDRPKAESVVCRQLVSNPIDEVWSFFSQPRNIEQLSPPSEVRLVKQSTREAGVGTRITLRMRAGLLSLTWVARIDRWEPPNRFEDRQEKGPFRSWRHRHGFEGIGDDTLVTDELLFEVPLGWLGCLFAPLVKKRVLAAFAYRQEVLPQLLENTNQAKGEISPRSHEGPEEKETD